MALIDQRILIEAPVEVVWDHLADPDKLTRWHVGYSSISILTTHRTGKGVRRRCALAQGGKDIIEEITAWVDSIGYEYVIVEGGPYREFQARLRLQPVPDGTSVQWTVEYKRKGLFGAIQDRLSGKRQLALQMTNSLRQLKRDVDRLGIRLDDTYRARVGIRERLDANERAEYQRRYAPPPGIDPIGAVSPEPTPDGSLPAVGSIPVASNAEPSFVADLARAEGDADYFHTADTQPKKPAGLDDAIAAQQATQDQPEAHNYVPEPNEQPIPLPPAHIAPPAKSIHPTPPRGTPTVKPVSREPSPPTPAHAMPPVLVGTDDIPTDEVINPQEAFKQFQPPSEQPASFQRPADESIRERADQHPGGLPPQTPITDTGEISIWEVFGMRRPSEQDTETLEELVQSVRARETAEKQRAQWSSNRRPRMIQVRTRRLKFIDGLRLRLVRRVVGVRRRV